MNDVTERTHLLESAAGHARIGALILPLVPARRASQRIGESNVVRGSSVVTDEDLCGSRRMGGCTYEIRRRLRR